MIHASIVKATIQVRGAREGGLQNVDLNIPLNAISCFGGPSGGGHRALMERVLYAESCSQYMRSLSVNRREEVVGAKRVDVDSITGLPPVVNYLDDGIQPSVQLAEFLGIESRLASWISRYGTWHCPMCEGICAAYRPEEVEPALFSTIGTKRVLLLAPIAEELIDGKEAIWEQLRSVGFVRVRIGGKVFRIEDGVGEWRGKSAEVVVDRLEPCKEGSRRFLEGVRSARAISGGQTHFVDEKDEVWRLNRDLTCIKCGFIVGNQGSEDLLADEVIAKHLRCGDITWSSLKSATVGEGLSAIKRAVDKQEEWMDVLELLKRLGLESLPIDQPVDTLSRSEWLRLRLASRIDSNMSGIVYLLGGMVSSVEGRLKDSIVDGIKTLIKQGNTVLTSDRAVEVQREAQLNCTFIRGHVSEEVSSQDEEEIDLPFFSGEKVPWEITGDGFWGSIDAKIPRGAIVRLVGKPGSGKTRLLNEVIKPLLLGKGKPYKIRWIQGKPRVHTADRTRKEGLLVESIGVSGLLAQVYASTPAGRDKGFPADFYRLDKVGGRCPSCAGNGKVGISMEFVEDIESECPACSGERFRSEVLGVTYRGKTIAQVLSTSVDSAYALLMREKRIADRLKWLLDRDFGHLKLGSQLADLEWPEAVRLQWVIGLKGQPTDKDFILADSFTDSLHSTDVKAFLGEFKRVVKAGGTVIVADNHPSIRSASSHVVEILYSEGERRLKFR